MHSFEEFDDFVNDDLTKPRKKRKNGKRKGNRTELDLTKVLNARFGTGFSRSVGSGNRWSQVSHLPKHARDVFSGDLVVPVGFRFAIESKGGYDGIDINSLFVRGNSELDSFLKQAFDDGRRCGRMPMLCWKRTRKPWLAFVLTKDLGDHEFKYTIRYGDWTGVALEHLLKLEGHFFIDGSVDKPSA